MFSLPKNEVPSHMKGGPVVKHHMHNFDDFGREKYRSERKTERSWKIEKKSYFFSMFINTFVISTLERE